MLFEGLPLLFSNVLMRFGWDFGGSGARRMAVLEAIPNSTPSKAQTFRSSRFSY